MSFLKNIVVVCDYAYFEGGAANVALQTALALDKYTDLNIYCFAGNGEPCEQICESGVKVVALKMPDLKNNKNKLDAITNGIYNIKAGVELKKLLSTLNKKDTIVHIHTWTKVLSSSVFKVCNEMNFKTFLTIHEYFLACPNGACYNFQNKKICECVPLSMKCLKTNCDSRSYPQKIWRCVRQIKQNNVIRRFDKLNYIFISKHQEKQLLKRMPDVKNKYLIKNPINISERIHINSYLNSDFVYIGRLSIEKGPDIFCEAITKANVHGVVIGTGELENELKLKYPQIEFTGWLNKKQITERLLRTRALIFPTLWYEGSPLTVPEVQAYGIPCIVSNCSSAVDDIVHGKNGEIVEPNPSNVADAIERFKDDDYVKKLSNNTYLMFDENRISDRWYVGNLIKIYEEKLDENFSNNSSV